MSDLINRQYAIRCIKEMASCADIVHEGKDYAYIIRHYSGNLTVDMHNIWDLFEEFIADLPSADAVEVVRCMNCIYGEERIEDYRCGKLDEDWDIRFSPTHYCSFGERKEE